MAIPRTPPAKRTALTPQPPQSQSLIVPKPSPHDVLAASQQQHIEELAERNRSLSNTMERLQTELSKEESRGAEAVAAMKLKWQEERKEWMQGCDLIQSTHRIAHLRTISLLEDNRAESLKSRETLRLASIKKLERDFKLQLFQSKELALERRIQELEQELQNLVDVQSEQNAELIASHEDATEELRMSLKDAAGSSSSFEKERQRLEKEISRLRSENATLTTSKESQARKLERTDLQVAGLQETQKKLHRENGELERSNSDLRRQLQKWQDLEKKDDVELEELRRRTTEAEVRVKELELRLADSQKHEKESRSLTKQLEKVNKKLEKEQERVDSLEKELADTQASLEEAREALNNAIAEPTSLPKSSARETKKERRHESVASNAKASSSRKAPAPPPTDVSESETKEIEPPARARSTSRKPSTKVIAAKAVEEPANAEVEAEAERDSSGDGQMSEAPQPRSRPKAVPAQKQKKRQESVQRESSDDGRASRKPAPKSVAKDKKGKGRADVSEVEDAATSRARSKARSKAPSPPGGGSDEEVAAPKKKRKLFQTGSMPPAMWNFGGQTAANSILNIPTELSPVKEGEKVPSRAGIRPLIKPGSRRF